MNIKSFMATAVAALTLAACDKPADDVAAPVEGTPVDLNDDGTVAEGPVNHIEPNDGEINPREVSEGNPAHLPN
jgi:hypothetical protein